MGNYYAVLDIQKIHTASALSGQEKHNDRAYRMNHVDESLSYLNKEIIPTGGISYTERWKEIMTEQGIKYGAPIKTRSNSVIALDIVTAFSPGAEKELDIDIAKWCDANKKWMEETFGEKNIIAMTLHMDETDETPHGRRGPHIHTQIVPIDDRGRLCARTFTGGKTVLKALQSSYGKAMSEFGLSRGEQNSKIKHTDRKRWYSTVSQLCNAKAPRIKDGETFEQYMDRLDEVFQDINLAARKTIDNYKRDVQYSQTRQAQIFGEYAYAINLQHLLEENFDGDERLVNERLKKYQILEKAVPRMELDSVIDKTIEKYPPENSLNYWRKGKKKRHKKWEDLPLEGENEKTEQNSGDAFEKDHLVENDAKEEKKHISNLLDEVQLEKETWDGSGKLGNSFGEVLAD